MVVVVPPPPTLLPDVVTLFHLVDDLLGRSPILVFYGPSATPTAAANNSRIQAHIFTPAGFQSYPRLTISPSSPLYTAVNCLPREEQGDDICRGLAYSLFKYFSELPDNVKQQWEGQRSAASGLLRSPPGLFSDAHAAVIAKRMVKVENVAEVIQDLQQALAEQSVSWLDLDVVMPPGSMRELEMGGRDSILPDPSDADIARYRYGEYAPIVELFGEQAFLPTSRIKRRPSKPTLQNSNTNFMRSQKEVIRREFCELLDTEESYVSKLYDLVHSVAADFRDKAKSKATSSTSPGEEALKGLFPPSLDRILEANTAFLDDLRRVVEETENAAIADIEGTPDVGTAMPQVPSRTDLTGTLTLAACMRSWFPRFAECYTEYTKAHSQMSHHLRSFMRDTGSSFSQRMQDTGEQRLMSMLIEPVQRLPRYNLYIDNILKQLPPRHAAVKGLLKARDLISEICAHDSMDVPPDQVVEKLRGLVPSWPAQLRPIGRLITAADVVEIPAPYGLQGYSARAMYGILLLFSDQIVILQKASKQVMAARGLLAQLDGTDVMRNDIQSGDLIFKESLALGSFDATEIDGRLLQILPLQDLQRQSLGPRRPGSSRPGSQNSVTSARVYHLTGFYESKTARFCEELVQARVEGRFTEAERESAKWEVHTCSAPDLSIFSAIHDEKLGTTDRAIPARIRVVIDPLKHVETVRPGRNGVEVVATLTLINDGFYRLEMAGAHEFGSKDQLTSKEFLPVLAKRLNNFLQMRNQIKNPALLPVLLLRNQSILQSIEIKLDDSHETVTKERATRVPQSPVKLLSSFFGASVSRNDSSLRGKHTFSRSESQLGEIPNLRPSAPSRRTSRDVPCKPSTPTELVSTAADALAKLEATLSSYVLALQARKGNIVGRVLRMRGAADELSVNELYNALLEDPTNYEIVAQASVDVLFCAFEKFVNIAWHDKIGPIISPALWKQIQAKLDSAYPSDFEDFFRGALSDLSPQNQRAFKSCVKLLVELLEGTGNDGDRGMITASFAEVLVPEGNPSDFVSVLDRLVEDVDPLLENSMLSNTTTPHGSVSEAILSKNRTVNSSSLTSNTSLRKKFGLSALTRKTSKHNDDEKPESGSVWRALSKSKTDEKSSSISKAASLVRSNSTDIPGGYSPKRPVSRDRPTVLGAFNFENSPLATIGESVAIGPPRKKRRSSLSDLTVLQASGANTPSFTGGNTPRKSMLPAPSQPATPSPVKPSLLPAPSITSGNSPPRREIREGSPSRTLPRPLNVRKNGSPTTKTDEVVITASHAQGHRRAQSSISGIPKLRSPIHALSLSERPNLGNARKLPSQPDSVTSSPEKKPVMKLKMQSPQKLRERVQNKQKLMADAGASFQDEMANITSEVAASRNGSNASLITTLEQKLAALQANYTIQLGELQAKLDTLNRDTLSSLQVSETRYKKLDELCKETNAENDLLYTRFNEELGKIVGSIRRGEGLEELRRRLKEEGEENVRLRKENARLKRENGGLKAQLREI